MRAQASLFRNDRTTQPSSRHFRQRKSLTWQRTPWLPCLELLDAVGEWVCQEFVKVNHSGHEPRLPERPGHGCFQLYRVIDT